MKRNVKFDDGKMDFVLNFCLDPSDPDPTWRKVRPVQVAMMKSKLSVSRARSEEVSEEDRGKMLGEDAV